MASYSGQMSNRPTPTRPPRPTNKRQVGSGTASSTNTSVTPDRNLPTYAEIIPGSSNDMPRRGSEGDTEVQEIAPNSKIRQSRSVRKPSIQRTRPEITIISSQPMRNHPAFADGSKGSCVPPEAPPSYDEAMKNTSPIHASISQSSNSEHATDRRENGGAQSGSAISGTTHHARAEIAPTVRSNLNSTSSTSSAFAHEQPSIIGLVSESSEGGNCNRNQNNSDQLANTPSLSENSQTSFIAARSTNAISSHSANASSLDTSRPTQSQVTSHGSSSVMKSPISTGRQTVKPPIPPKKHGLIAAVANHRNEGSRDNRQTSPLFQNPVVSASRSPTHSNVTNRSPVASARKLPPPPPQPHITPKQTATPLQHGGGSGVSLDAGEDWLYSTIKEPANKRVGKLRQVSTESEEAPAKDRNEAAPNQSYKAADNLSAAKNLKPAEVSEPTYASVKKSFSQKKPTPQPKPRHHTHQPHALAATQLYEVVEDTSSNTHAMQPLPPPIPESRPPPEDYEGIFSTMAKDSNVAKDFLKEDESNICEIDASGHPKSVERTKHQRDLNKADDKIDTLPGENGSAEKVNRANDPSLNESPYEQILYGSSSPDVSERRKPVPAARVKQLPFKPMLNPPPLPPTPRSFHGRSSYKTSLPNNNAFTQKEACSSRDIPSKRKAHTFKEKSAKSYVSHGNECPADKSFDAQANSTSDPTLMSKSKSFSFYHHKKRSESEQHPRVKVSPKSTDLSLNQSAHSTRNNKTKRAPPPRPPLPLIMQNKALHSKHDHHQNEGTGTSPSPALVPNKGNAQVYSVPVQHYSHPKPVQPHLPNNPASQSLPSQPTPAITKAPTSSSGFPSPKPRAHNQAAAALNENVKPIPDVGKSSKPARPPLIKTALSHANKPNVKQSKNHTETENSPFNVIKNSSESKEAASTVDQQMKNYMANETWCVATHDYQPPNFTDLSFSFGEEILVLKQIDDKLLFGRNKKGVEGSFPRKYVSLESHEQKLATGIPESSLYKTTSSGTNRNANSVSNNTENICVLGKAIALHNYKARDENDLSFVAGNEIEIVGNIGSEWLKGRIDQDIGIFPRNLVSFTPTHVNIGRDSRPVAAQASKTVAIALYEFTSIHDNELSLSVGDRVEVISRIDDEWLQGKKQGKVGIFPSAFVDLACTTSPLENETSSSLIGNANNNTEKSISKQHKSTENDKDDGHPLGFAVALYGFIGQNDTELTFKGHDVITITEKVNEEWLAGKVDGKSGMFPANYVKITHMNKEQH